MVRKAIFTPEFEQEAAMLNNPNLTDLERGRLETKLLKEIMRMLKLGAFASDDPDTSIPMDTWGDKEYYSGVVITQAWNYAIANYGKRDKETGEIIPFGKLWNSVWNIKSPDIILEFLEDEDGMNQRCKKAKVIDSLEQEAEKSGIDFQRPNFNVLNKGKLESHMADEGYSKKAIENAIAAGETSYISSDLLAADDDDDDRQGLYQSDIVVYNGFMSNCSESDCVIDAILNGNDIAKRPLDKEYLRYFATYISMTKSNDDYHVKLELSSMEDKAFASFMNANNVYDDLVDAVVAYKHDKRPTVLKNIRAIIKLMKKAMASSRSNENIR